MSRPRSNCRLDFRRWWEDRQERGGQPESICATSPCDRESSALPTDWWQLSVEDNISCMFVSSFRLVGLQQEAQVRKWEVAKPLRQLLAANESSRINIIK